MKCDACKYNSASLLDCLGLRACWGLGRPRRPGQTTVRTGIRKTATNRSIGHRRLSNLVLFWVGAWLKNRKTQGSFRGNCKKERNLMNLMIYC